MATKKKELHPFIKNLLPPPNKPFSAKSVFQKMKEDAAEVVAAREEEVTP